ncbi:MAG: helix-turn-helix transcriptional regulator, partial [Pseudonocardiaceae bacterium]
MSEGVASPWYEEPEARAALAARDVGAVFRLLQRVGVSQREIGRRTGQSQSEVSTILRNRTVLNVTVLERVCDGLDVPRAYMRLAGVAEGAYPGEFTSLLAEVDAEMYRRGLLGLAGVAFAGQPVPGLGKLVTLPGPSPMPVPSRVEGIHVAR